MNNFSSINMDDKCVCVCVRAYVRLCACACVILCEILAQGLIGLIGYLYQQVATSFPEAHLDRTQMLSVLGLG